MTTVERGASFAPAPASPEAIAAKKAAKADKPKRPREKFKNDPKIVEAAREPRDRSIDQIDSATFNMEIAQRVLNAAP